MEGLKTASLSRIPNRETPEDGADFCQVPKRWLSVAEVQQYTGLGRSSVLKLGQEIGCVRHFGRRVMYDRFAIDRFFAEQD